MVTKLTNEEIQAHLENQEQMEKTAKEAIVIDLSKPGLIKKRDVEYKVLQREHLDKLKKSRELKRKRFNQFGNFGVIEWDELSVIIPKTKNKVVEELMKSLCKKYERLKEIPGELGINSSFPLPEQDPSLSLSRKRKALELEPEVRIVSLECNHSLPKGIQFVNNKVNEIPEHGIFFIDSFGDQAFQKTSDIHKVEVESWSHQEFSEWNRHYAWKICSSEICTKAYAFRPNA
ncbi:hypothetical protein Tco_0344777 [Tanacetum coccineum]